MEVELIDVGLDTTADSGGFSADTAPATIAPPLLIEETIVIVDVLLDVIFVAEDMAMGI